MCMNCPGKVSVIVPVYNVEDYLDICVDSIVGQTYRDIEILLIDDGSKDKSPMICDQWSAHDSRVKVFHKNNGGLSDARNYGMKRATGNYLMFVDSDDWIDPRTTEHALEEALRNESDIVFWPYIREAPSEKRSVHFFPESRLFEGAEVHSILVRKLFGPYGRDVDKPEQMDWCSTACGKLYRSSLFLDTTLTFVDLKRIGTLEDGLFNISAFSKAHTVSYLDCNYYHYRRTRLGQLTSTYKPDFYHQTNELYSLLEQLCNELGDPENLTALHNRVAIGMSAQALNISRDTSSLFEKAERINEILDSTRYREAFRELDISGMPFHWKLFYLCCKKRWAFCTCLLADLMRRIKEKRNG